MTSYTSSDAASNREKPKVLVVDDEPRILDSIHDLLEDDFEVVSSTSASEALEFLKEAQVAVILADQRMPNLTGGEFLAKAREISEATRILITGYVDIDALISAVNDGKIHSYMAKPWEPASLRVTVLKAATYAKEVSQRKRAAEIVAEQQAALARSEEAYRQQTKILRSVLDSMSDGVLVTDENGAMLVMNPAAIQLLGAPAKDTPHSEWVEQIGIYIPGSNTPYPIEELPLARAMRGEVADAIELLVRNRERPDGMLVSVNVRPLKDDSNKVKGGVAVVRDITAARSSEELLLRAKEEAERANGAKSEFLSRMSHELRTPLNSILGFAQLLSLAELSPQHLDNVQQILKGGYHLLEMINEVLDLARIEAGRLGISMEPVRIGDVVTECLDLVRALASQHNITVSADLSGKENQHVQADRQRLKQVLLNLLSNAIKFNRANGTIVLTCELKPQDILRVEVADSGSGINEENLKKIFTPFERLSADRDAVGGTGLGLALSRRMIEAMGGTIGVESTPGTGSRFHFELALTQHAGDAGEKEESPTPPVPGDSASFRGTVLYIDDNLSNVRLFSEIVARYPRVQLLEATRGQLGLEFAGIYRPDWIVLDLHLPDFTGEEVLRLLRNDPRTEKIPVTVLSADATPGQVHSLKAAGAREYLTKPLNVRQLIELLEGTLQGENLHREDSPASPVSVAGSPTIPRSERPDTVLRWTPETISLMGLSGTLIEGMRKAIQDGQKDLLDELIASLAANDPHSAGTLKGLADNYEYDALAKLLTDGGE